MLDMFSVMESRGPHVANSCLGHCFAMTEQPEANKNSDCEFIGP